MSISFRHSAGFGKRMEYKLIGDMLMEGLDCYTPLVDDHGVDCVIKKSDGTFIEIQIKARSKDVTEGDAALFSAIDHKLTDNFYFVFYSERLDMMWIMSSQEFLDECVTNKNGKNADVIVFGSTETKSILPQVFEKNIASLNSKSTYAKILAALDDWSVIQ